LIKTIMLKFINMWLLFSLSWFLFLPAFMCVLDLLLFKKPSISS
jgi:hypothetical protein